MKVAVLGWYGHGNFGDALVLEGLRTLFKGWEINVFSDNAKSSYPMVDFDVVNKHDLFVLGGGELINGDRLFIESPWAHKIVVPKVVLGCGVNVQKLKQLKSKVVGDLMQFSFIGLRDVAAFNLLRLLPSLNGRVGLFYDLAFALDVDAYRYEPKNNYAVVIPTDRRSNRSDMGIRQFNVAKKSRDWLAVRLAKFDKAVFLPFGRVDNNDYETCKALSSCHSNSVIVKPDALDLPLVLRLIAGSSMVFPYRLHGLVLSYLLGAKCEFYPYHWKLARVNETVRNHFPHEVRLWQKLVFERMLDEVLGDFTVVHKDMEVKK